MRNIRASMLPSYGDCARRTAAKQYPAIIQAAGFELRPLHPSIGAAVGTATHKAAEHILRHKMETGALPADVNDAVAAALVQLREEIAPGAEWDDTTPNLLVAEFQVRRLAAAYLPVAAQVEPAAVELELAATIAPGWKLTGHLDLYTKFHAIDDLKTGAVRRPYQAQLGAYSLLVKSNGLPVERIGTTYIPRGRKTKPQPPAERTTYDIPVAESVAHRTIAEIVRDVEAFESSGDPYAFRANPMSLMCSPKYCPAWGTAFCKLHLPKEAHHGTVE